MLLSIKIYVTEYVKSTRDPAADGYSDIISMKVYIRGKPPQPKNDYM